MRDGFFSMSNKTVARKIEFGNVVLGYYDKFSFRRSQLDGSSCKCSKG